MTASVRVHAPGRVNLIGDHTDHMGGVALPCAIDLGVTITGGRATDIELTSSVDPRPVHLDLDPSNHPPLAGWERYVAAVAALVPTAHGVHANVDTDLPIGAGLSSSAALEIAVALALGFDGTPMELALLAQRAEHDATGAPTGLLDQLAITHGLADHALRIDFSALTIEPVRFPDSLDIVVVHSNEERTVETSAYATRVAECAAAVELVGALPHASIDVIERIEDPVLRRRARHVRTECDRVDAAVDALRSEDADAFGALMTESHRSLRDDFEVSTPRLDRLVDTLLAVPGVRGARLTGAGFGGCAVAVCDAGAIHDPSSFTGRGWKVRPSGAARAD